MKVLYLFNRVIGKSAETTRSGMSHDSGFFGMLRLPKYGIETDFLEIERYFPAFLKKWGVPGFLRKHILTMHYAHLPLFPLFFKYDIVFTSTAYGCLILKAMLGIRRFKWVILDFNILGTIQEEKTIRQKIFAWAIAKGADGVVAISQAEADGLKKRFPRLADRIIFLHEATDIDFFKPHPDIAEKDIVISVGNYGRDFDTIIEATKDLSVELRLATKLISIEQARSLPTHATAKLYAPDEIVRAYAEAKIAVVAIDKKDTHYDSVGTLALGEAFAMGKATIVTHMRSMESYVNDGKNALFVPIHDVAGMRKAVRNLLSDDALRCRIGEEARRFAVNNLDPDAFARKLAAFLKEVR